MMKPSKFVLVIVVSCFAIGLAFGDDPPTDAGTIILAYPPDGDFVVHLGSANGLVKHTVIHSSNSNPPVMFVRNSGSPSWATSMYSDEFETAYIVTAPEPSATMNYCCIMSCDSGGNFVLNLNTQDCDTPGMGCIVCEMNCTGPWQNCPRGTQKLALEWHPYEGPPYW